MRPHPNEREVVLILPSLKLSSKKSDVLIYLKCRSLAGSLSPSVWRRSSKPTLKIKVLLLVPLELSSTEPGSRDDPSIEGCCILAPGIRESTAMGALTACDPRGCSLFKARTQHSAASSMRLGGVDHLSVLGCMKLVQWPSLSSTQYTCSPFGASLWSLAWRMQQVGR